jgi:TolB-like protein
MERLKYLVIGILALTLAGCGQTIVETLNVPAAPGFDAPGKGRTVVILPFADYSSAGNIDSAYRRNLAISEALTDRFNANGFGMPVQEDVFQYLVSEGVINLIPYEETKSITLVNELSNDWSDTMKSEISRYIEQQNGTAALNSENSPGTHGLTTRTVAKIGRYFKADYIVRGRILEYKSRQDPTWEPWKKGILPFINGGTSRILFGFASSDTYDEWNQKATGAIYGARIGYKSNWPWDSDDGDDTILGISGGDDANAILWGAVGADLGRASYNSGRVDQAVVQLRIWVQEATSGNVVWTNRVDVKVSPESFLADNQYDALFDKAIEKGVTTLVDNFVTTGL